MANYVKISTICAAAITADGLTGQDAVNKMLEHWTNKLQKVLPEKPDLIVLPEACDRFKDMNIETRINYYEQRAIKLEIC